MIANSYINTKSFRKKAMLMVLFTICAGGYALSFYPAWMIPFFYVFLFTGIALLIENKQKLNIEKPDLLLASISILVLVLSFLYIWHKSKDTIVAVINTVYPGIRNEKGALRNVLELFSGWTSYLWTTIEITNPCEEVDFLSLFPLGTVLSLLVLYKQKKKDVTLKCLMVCNMLLIGFLLLIFTFLLIIYTLS